MSTETQNGTGMGVLAVDVYAGSVGVPIKGARVLIKGKDDVEIECVTNENGQTAEINLSCYPREFLEYPLKEKPYTEYDLKVTANGFEKTVIKGIKIFDTTTAIQRVILRRQIGGGNRKRTIVLNDHSLWINNYKALVEEEIADINKEIYIPEYIIIHDGEYSDDNAPNYYEHFKDYIKNVVSSSIYPTWSTESIEAATLIVLSYTLNRFHSEWYKTKGKNFTVTSKIGYDQPYCYFNTFYKEISDVVDLQFINFIYHNKKETPLLSLCNGWEIKKNADKVKGTKDILISIYGEIAFGKASKIMGVPLLFFGECIRIGTEGEDVRTLQKQLNVIAECYPSINKLKIDGVYGQHTAKSVKEFQRAFRLSESTDVDFSVWYSIGMMYTAVKRTLV